MMIMNILGRVISGIFCKFMHSLQAFYSMEMYFKELTSMEEGFSGKECNLIIKLMKVYLSYMHSIWCIVISLAHEWTFAKLPKLKFFMYLFEVFPLHELVMNVSYKSTSFYEYITPIANVSCSPKLPTNVYI